MQWADIIFAGISALTGGGLLKVFEYSLNRTKEKTNQAYLQRQEIRQELDDLRQQLKDLKQDLLAAERREDEWRMKYWEMHFKYNSLLIERGKYET